MVDLMKTREDIVSFHKTTSDHPLVYIGFTPLRHIWEGRYNYRLPAELPGGIDGYW